MLALYSHILIQLKDTTKRIKSARKREMDQKDGMVSHESDWQLQSE